jgi:hypothetical protein
MPYVRVIKTLHSVEPVFTSLRDKCKGAVLSLAQPLKAKENTIHIQFIVAEIGLFAQHTPIAIGRIN